MFLALYPSQLPEPVTKGPEAFAVPDQEATTVANLLVCEFVCRDEVPLDIHLDQERNMESAVFFICAHYWKTRTTPYYLLLDEIVEQLNRHSSPSLCMTDWDTYLPVLMMAYRTAVQESTSQANVDLYARPTEERPKNKTIC